MSCWAFFEGRLVSGKFRRGIFHGLLLVGVFGSFRQLFRRRLGVLDLLLHVRKGLVRRVLGRQGVVHGLFLVLDFGIQPVLHGFQGDFRGVFDIGDVGFNPSLPLAITSEPIEFIVEYK